MEIAHISEVKIFKKYDPVCDAALYKLGKRPFLPLRLNKGDIVILFPEDAHMPCINYEGVKTVKKVILKVKKE